MSFNADSFCGLLPASFVLISVMGGLVALPHHVISAFFNERLVTSRIRECGHWLENASKMTGRRVEGMESVSNVVTALLIWGDTNWEFE